MSARCTHGHGVAVWGQGGFSLPYTVDFTALPDGPLPSPFAGATWAISGGKAINTPTLGAELLTDPGVEATYTDGKCDSILIASGSPTLADGAPDVHGGSHSQSMANAASGNSISWVSVTPTAGKWYVAGLWNKRTGGAGNGPLMQLVQPGVGLPEGFLHRNTQDATWANVRQAIIAKDTSALTLIMLQYGTGQTVLYDDGSLKAVTAPTQFAFLANDVSADVVLKLSISAYDMLAGIILRANSRTAPATYLAALMYKDQPSYSDVCKVCLVKFVNGVPSSVIDAAAVTFVADADLEVRASGSTVSLWYNDTQVDTDKTVVDGATNAIHGMISTGGGETIKRFFVAAS